MLHAGLIGSPCSETSDCLVVDLHSRCDSSDHICVCDEDRSPADDRRRCVLARPAAEIAVVAVCIVVICLLVLVIAFLVVWLFKAFVCLKSGQSPPSNSRQLFAVVAGRSRLPA